MRLSVLLAILPVVLGAPTTTKRATPAPVLIPRGDDSNLIADKYIVKFREGSSLASVEDAVTILSEGADHIFHHAFQGFSGTLDKETLEALREHPDVSLHNTINETRESY